MAGSRNKFTEVACATRKGKAIAGMTGPPPKQAHHAKEVIILPLPPPPATEEPTLTQPESSTRGKPEVVPA